MTLTVVVRNELRSKSLADITSKYVIADVFNKARLENIFDFGGHQKVLSKIASKPTQIIRKRDSK
ncbi:MAG: hypothetical protein KatS3mg035_0553 [Bacteroidia bacterium]|nr:MAG: hypothetical protein KatS3mg035_0553 [Bacteroidia bacterium]